MKLYAGWLAFLAVVVLSLILSNIHQNEMLSNQDEALKRDKILMATQTQLIANQEQIVQAHADLLASQARIEALLNKTAERK